MILAQQLERLVQELEDRGWKINTCLRPGLDSTQIYGKLASLGLRSIPTALRELYQWHDGTPEDCDIPLFDEHYFLALDDAIDEYSQTLSVYRQFAPLENFEYEQCFPFANFMGSSYAIYCSDQSLQNFVHPIIRVFQGVDVSFMSLEMMVETIIEWYVSGAYNMQPLDEQRTKQIWRTLNPGIIIP